MLPERTRRKILRIQIKNAARRSVDTNLIRIPSGFLAFARDQGKPVPASWPYRGDVRIALDDPQTEPLLQLALASDHPQAKATAEAILAALAEA